MFMHRKVYEYWHFFLFFSSFFLSLFTSKLLSGLHGHAGWSGSLCTYDMNSFCQVSGMHYYMVLKPNKHYGSRVFVSKLQTYQCRTDLQNDKRLLCINEVDSSSWMTFASRTLSLIREQETDLFEEHPFALATKHQIQQCTTILTRKLVWNLWFSVEVNSKDAANFDVIYVTSNCMNTVRDVIVFLQIR